MATKKRSAKSQPASVGIEIDRGWRARDALATLTRAQEIRSDKKLMADVKREAGKQQTAIKNALGQKSRSRT